MTLFSFGAKILPSRKVFEYVTLFGKTGLNENSVVSIFNALIMHYNALIMVLNAFVTLLSPL